MLDEKVGGEGKGAVVVWMVGVIFFARWVRWIVGSWGLEGCFDTCYGEEEGLSKIWQGGWSGCVEIDGCSSVGMLSGIFFAGFDDHVGMWVFRVLGCLHGLLCSVASCLVVGGCVSGC